MIIIKRYPNRKLYNTDEKQYITLEGIADLIRKGEVVQVIDHATGEDLTALTLTQIILEQEKRQSGLLSNTFLTSLIQAGGDRLLSLQSRLGSSSSFLYQVDEEIRQRVLALARQGEITIDEAEKLIERLLQQGDRQREESQSKASRPDQIIETYLRRWNIPTHDDLKKLEIEIEELSAKIDQLNLAD